MRKEFCKKIFLAVFSTLIFSLFYMLISSNGLILGNDPAVHLEKAYEMLETGTVSLSEITRYPPLYRILLAEYIVFTGATSVEQALLLVKMLTVTIDWLLIFSVYLLGARLLGEECGIIASSFMLLCFPLYEINFWGGYPSLLTVAYFCLLLFYLSSKNEGLAHNLIIFLITFSIFLTHQFATFLVSIILVLYALFLLIFRRSINRLLAIAIIGASAAFLLWYVPIIMPYLNVLIFHIFFRERQYLYAVKYVSLDAFLLNFGFIILFSFLGTLLAFYECRRRKELDFFMLLCLGFFVPLLFTQSYLLNILLPYDRFVYYLMPPAVVFAAAIVCLLAKFAVYSNPSLGCKNLKFYLNVFLTISLVVLLVASRFPALTDKISEAKTYYSYMDLPSYKAGLWLKTHYPNKSTVIVTEKPGLFFGLVSGKFTIMETNPTVERATVAETVLDLAYEMENPVTLYRVFEARMPYELDQYNVLIHNVWKRTSFLYDEETSLSYFENGRKFSVNLSNLERKILWVNENGCKKLQIQYSLKDKFELTENVEMKSDRLPATVNWVFTSLSRKIENLCINISLHFDLSLLFEKAYTPGVLNWESPWDKPSYVEANGKWALVYFYPKNLTENYVAIYDSTNHTFYAMRFTELPTIGSVGVLASKQIDALRLRYDFENVNQTVSFTYSVLNLSEESLSFNIFNFKELFDLKGNFSVQSRDYLDYSKEYGIVFLVFEARRFKSELLNAKTLQLIYSNDEYVICKIK